MGTLGPKNKRAYRSKPFAFNNGSGGVICAVPPAPKRVRLKSFDDQGLTSGRPASIPVASPSRIAKAPFTIT